MEWKIRRGEQEFTAPDMATLQQWAATGRVVPSDYVLNPTLQQWVYARDVAELSAVTPKPRSAARGACGLAVALFLFAVMLGAFGMGEGLGMLLGAGAFIFAIIGGVLYVLKR